MKYVTVAKLQSKLEGEANQSTVRKIITKMAQDGFVEAKGNRRLGLCSHIENSVLGIILHDLVAFYLLFFHLFYNIGKRVINSERTKKKLLDIKKALSAEAMVLEKISLFT
jgi:meiosis-specific protein HOP1